MKKIPLLGKYSNQSFAVVDDDDFEKISRWRWFLSDFGYARSYLHKGTKTKIVFMHRVILKRPEHKYIDHINGDRIDNRKLNLRICTREQNAQNRKPNKNSESGLKGVYRSLKKWAVQIKVNKKRVHLGSFRTKEEGARAYDKAAKYYFGEFAYQNNV